MEQRESGAVAEAKVAVGDPVIAYVGMEDSEAVHRLVALKLCEVVRQGCTVLEIGWEDATDDFPAYGWVCYQERRDGDAGAGIDGGGDSHELGGAL